MRLQVIANVGKEIVLRVSPSESLVCAGRKASKNHAKKEEEEGPRLAPRENTVLMKGSAIVYIMSLIYLLCAYQLMRFTAQLLTKRTKEVNLAKTNKQSRTMASFPVHKKWQTIIGLAKNTKVRQFEGLFSWGTVDEFERRHN